MISLGECAGEAGVFGKYFRPAPVNPQFQTTHWSVVLAAREPASPHGMEALESLCRTYWRPIFAFLLRSGCTAAEAEDLTQTFFCRLLDKNRLGRLTKEGGRFRSFLLTALRRFLINDWEKARTQKRGAGQSVVSLDELRAAPEAGWEPASDETPDRVFERRWAMTVLNRALEGLREEYAAHGKAVLFEHLRPHLSGDEQRIPIGAVAAAHGLTEGAVKVAVHRLRRRYGEMVRSEVAQTVVTAAEINDEVRHLLEVLSR
ncbi:MAG: sigma-70 family RNA polymerase sigma factor [Verrucomicrobiae bacterium]|nr:sigma-70 family RNA polymerase sigma factor [Verrucomicrobiae bacterium]